MTIIPLFFITPPPRAQHSWLPLKLVRMETSASTLYATALADRLLSVFGHRDNCVLWLDWREGSK